MNEFQKQAMLIALKKTFEGRHFDICVVDSCAKIIGASLPTKEYAALRLLHCVDWSEMPSGFKEQVFAKTMEMLDTPTFSFDEMMAARALAITEEQKCGTGFLKLLKS